MIKEQIREYVNNRPPTLANLRGLCESVFASYASTISPHYQTRLKFIAVPGGGANASVRVNMRKRKATVSCNLLSVKKRTLSAGLKYFHLCTAVLHEVEHLRLISKMREPCSESNPFSMVLCEQATRGTERFFSRFVHAVFSRWVPTFRNAVHMSSTEELCCMERSHAAALELFADLLEEEDLKRARELHQAISFMERCNEIIYLLPSCPRYKTAYVFPQLQRRIAKDPDLMDKYPALMSVFTKEGQLISVTEMFNKAAAEGNSFYNKLVMRLFLDGFPEVEKQLGEDKALFDQIERTSNEYCQLCVDFVKNKQLCMQWFDKSLVEDNVAMMIKNCKKLEKQMEKAGMRLASGRLFPMYPIR